MFARLQHGRTILERLPGRTASLQAHSRTATTIKAGTPSMLKATGDTARKLAKSEIWKRTPGKRKTSLPKVIDPRRVNIVSKGLCDDIVKYIGPSLERHRGCDLIDLNPGVGEWSRALHDVIQPRKHVMMDLDAELYKPFLADLLAKENVELIPKSGIVWKDLFEMIDTHLTNQVVSTAAIPERNDTLLVTANISMFPKKKFSGFDSVSSMVLYQLMSSIRTSTLFQRYGLVRMLIWVNDDEKRRLLPRSINRRKRSVFEAEISCEWIHEVVGEDAEFQDRTALRDKWINIESGAQALERMAAQGLEMPKGRETRMYMDLKNHDSSLIGQKLAGVRMPDLSRPFKQELEELEEELRLSKSIEASKRLKSLRTREKYEIGDALIYQDMIQQREAIGKLAATSPEEFEAANQEWNNRIENLKKNSRNELNVLKDSYHIFRQSPPALLWDRRAYEPLSTRADDFFPNAPAALLDIQPKAMNPLFRQYGPHSSRAGDMSEVMLRFWFHHTLLPIQKAMEGLWGGFGDLAEQCPSVTDLSRGGTPMTGRAALSVRSMNEEQWAEILQAWMDWPFRPSYTQMLGRLIEDTADGEADEEETKSGAGGVAS